MSLLSPPDTDSVKLISAFRLRNGQKDAFLDWNSRITLALAEQPGFISREVIPPQSDDLPEWIFIIRFASIENLRAWRSSPTRLRLLEEVKPLIETEYAELAGTAAAQYQAEGSVTEVILDHIIPGKEQAYQDWSNRIQKAQAESLGYQGGYTQPARRTGEGWMTLMRFSSVDDLNRWMNSPLRLQLQEEAKQLVIASYQHRVDTSFPGWVPSDAAGRTPPNWKITMLVLLGLYPLVCLEVIFLMKNLAAWGLNGALAGFIGNAISVFFVAYVTMPLLCRWLDWWLFPKPGASKSVHWKGALIVVAFYALSIAIFWNFR